MSELRDRFFDPIDIASLVYFRVTFGALMVWELLRYLQSGKVRALWIDPTFYFNYYGSSWIEPLPGDGMIYFVAGLAAVAALFAAGVCYRLTAWLFFLGFTYLFLIDQAKFMNHFYLISLLAFIAAIIPMGRATAPAWTLWLLRAQMGIVYFYGGIAKINADWLRAKPVDQWMAQRADNSITGKILALESTPWAIAYGGLLFDLCIVPLLLWKPTRLLAFLAAVAFHLINARLFTIGVFPFLAIAMTALFFDPSWPRLIREKFWDGKKTIPKKDQATHSPYVLPFLTVYLAIQILAPLRHVLYPGTVHWTEEGHRFSWHMMLRSKTSRAIFTIRHPHSDEVEIVKPLEFLTGRQYLKMINRPDMILQFCHHLAATKEGNIQVFAQVYTSLNGRPEQLLLDPSIDLAAQPRNLSHADWITDLREELR